MGRAEEVVRAFFERMQARDWPGAGACLSPEVRIEWTTTGELFEGEAFLAMNRAYPEGWTIEVIDVIADGDRAAAQVRVDHGADTFWCAGFYTVAGGLIVEGVEHWVTAGAENPPGWRAEFGSG